MRGEIPAHKTKEYESRFLLGGTFEVDKGNFRSGIFQQGKKKIEADGLDPLECIEVVHVISDGGELEIEVYLEIPSDKLKK